MSGLFSGRKFSLVLETQLNKQINEAVRHIDNILNRLFGIVIVDQETEFFNKFLHNGLAYKLIQHFSLNRHIHILIPASRLVFNDHLSKLIQAVINKLK